MAETLGTLIDKLTIANIRLWHLEDIRRDLALPDKERLQAADKIAIVNSMRNDLMDEIDEYLYNALHGKVKLKAPKVKKYKDFTLPGKKEQQKKENKKQAAKKSADGKKNKKSTKKS